MINLTLKQLRYFDSVLKQGHFGRAAETCAVSQPALSIQIKDLEESLGVTLFERGSRGVTPTAFADSLAPRIRAILREVDELGEMARAAQGALSGRLRLGVIPTVAPYLLPRLISAITENFPDVDLHVRESMTQRLVNELVDGRLDAALVALPVNNPALTSVELFTEHLVFVRPAEDAEAPAPARDELQKMRLLLLEEGHCFRDQALSYCGLPSSQPRDGLDGSSLATLVQMVGSGIGVTMIPEMAIEVETKSAKVSVSRFSDAEPSRRIGMLWRRTTPLHEQLETVAQITKDLALAQQDDIRRSASSEGH
ncbi:MAG: LysR substrate-binding domain-containing protein [Pseudomonadota bacterium]